MPHIPFDLVAEILCRLRVKCLLRFRCVCKSWNSLIAKDLKFAKKHLCVSITRHHLIATTYIPSKQFSVLSYPLDFLQLNSIFTTKAINHEYYSLIHPNYYRTLVTSCDGLLCFAINRQLALLWNPSIRKLKRLPSLEFSPREHGYTTYAFGYDPFIDNYKVVFVSCYYFEYEGIHMKGCKTQVNIYTLGTHSWRRTKDFPSMIPYDESGIIVSGTVNWLAYSRVPGKLSRAIFSLDLGKECYEEISQPNYGMPDKLTLGMMRDICLCIFSHSLSLRAFTNVWLMKEYGIKESWVKLIRLRFPTFCDSSYFLPKIVYVSEDDNHVLLLFREDHTLNWVFYNSKNDTAKSLKIKEDLKLIESKVYVESLISP